MIEFPFERMVNTLKILFSIFRKHLFEIGFGVISGIYCSLLIISMPVDFRFVMPIGFLIYAFPIVLGETLDLNLVILFGTLLGFTGAWITRILWHRGMFGRVFLIAVCAVNSCGFAIHFLWGVLRD